MSAASNIWFGPQQGLAAGFLNPPDPDPPNARDPERIGRYTVTGRLGVGGMGVVYLARHDTGHLAALKLVHEHLAEHAEFRARFVREVAAARRVSGRYTARVLDADVLAEQPWVATEYFRCWTLEAQVARFGTLSAENIGTLIGRLAEALAAMHADGLVHRDLKPSNILLAPDGPRVIDFGIARAADLAALTSTGRTPGTPGYMAPEQIDGRPVGPPADVFSLGAIAVFAATGNGPFGVGPPAALMYRAVQAVPELGETPRALRKVVSRCLDKDPERRPTAAELRAEFGAEPESHALVAGNEARSPTTDTGQHTRESVYPAAPTGPEVERRSRKRALLAVLSGAAFGALVLWLVLANIGGSGPSTSPPTHAPTSSTTTPQRTTSQPTTSTPPTSTASTGPPPKPPALPQSLIGYTGRLMGANLTWLQSLDIRNDAPPWTGGSAYWTAIDGPGCTPLTGHAFSNTSWQNANTGGIRAYGCDGSSVHTATVAAGQPATAHATWSFDPGPLATECALIAYNPTGPENRAYADYMIPGVSGQFPMSGDAHAGEWIELGVVDTGGKQIQISVANDQSGERPSGLTDAAAQLIAVCGSAP